MLRWETLESPAGKFAFLGLLNQVWRDVNGCDFCPISGEALSEIASGAADLQDRLAWLDVSGGDPLGPAPFPGPAGRDVSAQGDRMAGVFPHDTAFVVISHYRSVRDGLGRTLRHIWRLPFGLWKLAASGLLISLE